ncbi:MAG: glutamate 5-kinase [Mariprofundaceae bacterium]
MIRSRTDLQRVKRLVVKIGSSLLADRTTGVNQHLVNQLADEVAAFMAAGREVAIVSSGAVALGCVHMGWVGRQLSVHEKQAAAAIGQTSLMRAYEQAFGRHGLGVAQMLLTKDDLRHRRRYLNASNTSETLFSAGVIPVVNENDTVVVQEIKFGDNDSLGALASLMIDADLLAMLTDVDALYEANPMTTPDAGRIGVVEAITPKIIAMAGDADSHFGTGGMASKLRAARIATRGGVTVAIVSGQDAGILSRLLDGEDTGTLFLCGTDRHTRRQHWIADVLHPAGVIRVDGGAESALLEQGSSLLPVGVVEIEGTFDKGECVEIAGPSGPIARGLCNYSSDEMLKIIGASSNDIETILGYRDFSSVIHRDNLVLCRDADG